MLTHNEVWRRYLALHYPPLLLLLAAALVQGSGGGEYLQYDRPAILDGQIWRLWTAHLVHLGWGHYLLNAAGLMLVWGLFRDNMQLRAWCWHFLFAGLAIGLGLLWFDPGLFWYVGLSGILHALFIAGLLADIRQHKGLGVLVLLGFWAKIIFEQIYGPLPGSERSAGGPVVVDAHLYGAIAGVISYAIHSGVRKLKHFSR
ncbi:MAG TPA: rhombosortase [Gammaproteobacteria bacterium]|nr:rhombosortase [Gammaproteobacteria bacterium]